jgi:hypothetical protein
VTQIPIHSKFFKEILSNRRKFEEEKIFTLTDKVSIIIINKLPSTLRDPSSFIISYVIDNINFNQALCNLDTSVSLMPKSVFDTISIGELI